MKYRLSILVSFLSFNNIFIDLSFYLEMFDNKEHKKRNKELLKYSLSLKDKKKLETKLILCSYNKYVEHIARKWF